MIKFIEHISHPGYGYIEPYMDADSPLIHEDIGKLLTQLLEENVTNWKTGVPPNSKPVLAVTTSRITGSVRMRRTIVRAQHIKFKEMKSENWDDNEETDWYDEKEDCWYIDSGWYELMDCWEEYGYIRIYDPVIAWCELPKLPEET
jgi:hypothetical protein